MKSVIWEDKHGYKHRSLIYDDDPDDAGPQGLLTDPPNVRELDWEGVQKDLHNALVEMGAITWKDIQANSLDLRGAIYRALKTRLIELYRADARRQ